MPHVEHAIGKNDESALRWAVGGHLYAVTVKSANIYGRALVFQTNDRARALAEYESLRGRQNRARVFERTDTDQWKAIK